MAEFEMPPRVTEFDVPNIQLAGNSETKKTGKIIKKPIRFKEKSMATKVKEAMLGDKDHSIFDYIIYDVLIPAVKNTITDALTGGIDMLFYGERRNKNVRREGMKSYVNYSSYYNGNPDTPPRANEANRSSQTRFEDIIFSSRGDAEDVLSRMHESIEEYGLVSVADFLEMCGLKSQYTDQRIGWSSLKESFTERTRDGYTIHLPRTKSLN